jgi:hypothetical protein
MSDNLISKYSEPVGHKDIRFVVASRKVYNEIAVAKDPLKDMPILFPSRERVNPINGCNKISSASEVKRGGYETVQKILRGDSVVYRKVSAEVVKSSKIYSKAPYLMMIHCTRSAGKFNSVILKNHSNLRWSRSIFAFECNSKGEAETLMEWLNSRKIQEYVEDMLRVKGGMHTLSVGMLSRLPKSN